MILSLPLKITDHTPLKRDFEVFVKSQYGGDQSWRPVAGVFEQMDSLRQKLDFSKVNLMDPKTAEEIQNTIMDYSKYAYFLERRFKFQAHEVVRVDTRFAWCDSFEKQRRISHPSINYELAALNYNLTVSLFAAAMHNFAEGKSQTFVNAIKRCNAAIGCLKELRRLRNLLIPEIVQVNVDLSQDNIDMLEYLATGLGNAAFFEVKVSDTSLRNNQVACLAGEAGTNFQLAFQIVAREKQNSQSLFPSDYLDKIKNFLQYNAALYIGKAAFKMFKHFQTLLKDERKEKYMSFCLGYLGRGKTILSGIMGNQPTFQSLPKGCQDNLNFLFQEFDKNLKICEEQNAQIYQVSVAGPDQLEPMVLQQEWRMLTGKFNPQINEEIEEKSFFDGFLDTEQMMLATSCRAVANDQKQDMDLAYRSLLDRQNVQYNSASVLYFINLLNTPTTSGKEVPKPIKEQIATFISKGGQDRLKAVSTSLRESASNCTVLIKSVKEQLENQAQQDQKMRDEYKDQWNRLPSSNLNSDFFKNLKTRQQNANQASQSDQETLVKLESAMNFVQYAYLSEQQLLKKLPQSAQEQLLALSKEDFNLLIETDQVIMQKLQEIRVFIGVIYSRIDNTNYTQAVLEAVVKGVPKDQIVNNVIDPIQKEIEKLHGQMEHVNKAVDQASVLSLKINQVRTKKTTNTQSLSQLDQIGGGLETILQIFNEIEAGLEFYAKFFNQIIDLDKTVSDFVMARQYELNNLKQAIDYQVSQSQIRISSFGDVPEMPPPPPSNPLPYYANNQFPQGQAQPFGGNIYPSNYAPPPPNYLGGGNPNPYNYPPPPPNYNPYGNPPK